MPIPMTPMVRVEAGGPTARLVVHDRGIGIAPEDDRYEPLRESFLLHYAQRLAETTALFELSTRAKYVPLARLVER